MFKSDGRHIRYCFFQYEDDSVHQLVLWYPISFEKSRNVWKSRFSSHICRINLYSNCGYANICICQRNPILLICYLERGVRNKSYKPRIPEGFFVYGRNHALWKVERTLNFERLIDTELYRNIDGFKWGWAPPWILLGFLFWDMKQMEYMFWPELWTTFWELCRFCGEQETVLSLSGGDGERCWYNWQMHIEWGMCNYGCYETLTLVA